MSKKISNYELLKWYLIEEWRMFTTLFGMKRFMLFPLIIFTFAFIIGYSIDIVHIDDTILIPIYYILIVFMGLQTGKIGFDAQDSLNNIFLEDTSRILSIGNILPITNTKLISVFLLKDILFYSALFLIPISLGVISALIVTSSTLLSTTLFVELYVSTLVTFIFGTSVGLFVTTINIERLSSVIIASIILTVLYLFSEIGLFDFTIYTDVSYLYWISTMSMMSVILILLTLLQFNNNSMRSNKNYTNIYNNKYIKIINKYNSLNFKNILDIHRSSGGLFKIIFSTMIIVLFTFILTYFMSISIGLASKMNVLYATFISLISYPMYSILFRYDDLDTYFNLPVSFSDYYISKLITYSVILLPISIIFYTILTISEVNINQYISGLLIMISLLYYQFGILLYIGQDNPSKMLFNGFAFLKYSILIMIAIIPLIMVGLYGLLFNSVLVFIIQLYAGFIGLIGILLIYNYVKI